MFRFHFRNGPRVDANEIEAYEDVPGAMSR